MAVRAAPIPIYARNLFLLLNIKTIEGIITISNVAKRDDVLPDSPRNIQKEMRIKVEYIYAVLIV